MKVEIVTSRGGRRPLGKLPNGSAVKLPAPKCTSQFVSSMIWCEDPPATHIYRPAKAPVSFKRRLDRAAAHERVSLWVSN